MHNFQEFYAIKDMSSFNGWRLEVPWGTKFDLVMFYKCMVHIASFELYMLVFEKKMKSLYNIFIYKIIKEFLK